jgi:dihydropyrimidinase
MDIAVRGGTMVTADSRRVSDLGIRDGVVEQIGGSIPPAAREIDASEKLIFPGGLDMHVHLSPAWSGDEPSWVDDFASGSRAAAAGGVTTIGNMTFPFQGEGIAEAVERTRAKAETSSIVDFVLHPVLTDPGDASSGAIRTLSELGCRSIKIFMVLGSFDSNQRAYLKAMAAARDRGMVTMIHCEDAGAVDFLTSELIAVGKQTAPYYVQTRPRYVEALAVRRAVALGRLSDAPIYLVHISSADALEAAKEGRTQGVRVAI